MPKMANSAPPPPEQARSRLLGRAESFLGRLAGNRVFIAIGVLVALGFAGNAVRRALRPHHSSEFGGFREIVQVSIGQGRDPYTAIQHVRGYPPFFAIAFAPFGLPPLLAGAILFVAVSIFFGLWAIRLCATACQPSSNVRGRAMLLFLLAGGFIGAAIARCESDMLVVLPVTAAFYLLLRQGGRSAAAAGALLGFATALKLTPALFGLYLLVQRRWLALVSMAATAALLVAGLGSAVWGIEGNLARHRSWYEVVMRPLLREGPTAFIDRPYRHANQSLTAGLFRFLNAHHAGTIHGSPKVHLNVADLRPEAIRGLANCIKLPILVVLIVAWWRASRRPGWLPNGAAFGLTVLGTLLLSPISLHTHHSVLLIPLAVVLVALSSTSDGRHRCFVARTLVAAVVLICLTAIEPGKECSTLMFADLLLVLALLALAFAGQPGAMSPGAAVAPGNNVNPEKAGGPEGGPKE